MNEEDKLLIDSLRKKYEVAKNTAEKMKEAIEALGGSVYDEMSEFHLIDYNITKLSSAINSTTRNPYDSSATWRAKVLYALNALDGGTFTDIFNYLQSTDKTILSNKEKSNNAVRSLLSTLKSQKEITAAQKNGKLFYFPIKKEGK